MYLKLIATILTFVFLFNSCTTEKKNDLRQVKNKEAKKEIVAVEKKDEINQVLVNFELVALQDTLNWIQNLSEDSLHKLLVLNRIDKAHISSVDSILIPDVFLENINDYCPFPLHIDSLMEINKIIFVSRYAQLFAVYENGKRVKWGPTSSGKEATQTPAGLFSTNWKRKRNISSINSSWILNWCFNISNGDGVSLHEFDLPGKPASHACVRLYAKDAEWIYHWAEQWMLNEEQKIIAFGTPVVIFGDYPFDGRKPWWELAENPNALILSPDQLFSETKAFYQTIIERQKTLIWEQKKKVEKEMKNTNGLVVKSE